MTGSLLSFWASEEDESFSTKGLILLLLIYIDLFSSLSMMVMPPYSLPNLLISGATES